VEEAGKAAAVKSCAMCNREFTEDTTFCPHDGSMLAPAKQKIGTGYIIAGRYEIVQSLGDGGMGHVFQARDRMLKRFVAIKMLRADFTSSSMALQRFQKEAEAVSALNHPHIVALYDFGVAATGEPYIVMDCIEGVSFDAAIQDHPLPIIRARKIFIQISSALMHAHQRGVIHRDIKPSNILLTEVDGDHDFVKVIDFGIAKLLDPTTEHSLTTTGDVFGSPQYMSPEQCRGQRLDERSDIYSFGCVMFRALTGRLPFSGSHPSEFIYKHVHEEVPSVVTEDIHIPSEMEEIVVRCLHKDPAARFQSMSELKEALSKLDERQSSLLPPLAPIPPAAPAEVTRPKNVRNKILAVILLLLVVAAAAGFLTYKSQKQEKARAKLSDHEIKQFLSSDKTWGDPARKAKAYWETGDYLRAMTFARQAEERSRSFPPDDPRVAFSQYMLGLFDWAQGDYAAARVRLEEALRIENKIARPRSPEIADMEVTLGATLAALGEYKRAAELIDDCLSIREEYFGAGSLPVAECLYANGYLYEKQGKYDLAVKSMTQALYTMERSKGTTKADIADALVDLADAYREWGNYSTAEMLYKRALDTEKPSKDAKLCVAKAYAGLAQTYLKRSNYKAVVSNAQEAIAYFDNQLGPINPRSAEMRRLVDDALSH
jgi:serine/threonine protein kinase